MVQNDEKLGLSCRCLLACDLSWTLAVDLVPFSARHFVKGKARLAHSSGGIRHRAGRTECGPSEEKSETQNR